MAIVTSISPLAALTSMIAGDKAEVVSMCSCNQCPHHYFVKPHQFSHLKKAHLIIYIDDKFELFMQNVLKDNKASVLKLSTQEQLKTKAGDKENWHLWLNTHNIKVILNAITMKLSETDLANKDFYDKNLLESLAKLEIIEKEMASKLRSLPKPILLDDSLNYFFSNFKSPEEIINFGDKKISLKVVEKIHKAAKESSAKCVFVSSHQDQGKFQNLLGNKIKVITINTESWPEEGDLENIMAREFKKVIESLEECK